MSSGENVFADPECWAQPARDGGFILTDPVSGDQVNPNVPPAWIEEDPNLYAGLSFLRSCPNLIDLTIAFGRHDVAEDLGDPAKGWFEKQVAQADYFADEDYGYTEAKRQKAGRIAQDLLARAIPLGATWDAFLQVAHEAHNHVSTYELRQARASALAATTESFSYDLAADGLPIERNLIDAFTAIKEGPSTLQAGIALAGLHNVREWIGIPKTGLTVLKGAQQRDFSPATVFKTIGAAHKDISRKYHTLGVESRNFLLRPALWQNSPSVAALSLFGSINRLPKDVAPLLAKTHAFYAKSDL